MNSDGLSSLCMRFGVIISLLILMTANPLSSQNNIHIESISIDEQNEVRIKYFKEGDYTIERFDVVYYETIDPIDPNPETISIIEFSPDEATFPNPAAEAKVLHLRLVAFDTDDNAIIGRELHSTIFLEDNAEQVAEGCDIGVRLNWMNYAIYPFPQLNFPKPLPFHTVQVLIFDIDDEGLSDPEIIATFDQSLWDSQEIISFDRPPGTYAFQIRSVGENDLSATSNIIMVNIDEFIIPESVEITKVDVIDNQFIRVHVLADDFGFGEFEYRLYRSDDPGNEFQEITAQLHDSEHFYFDDEDVPGLDDNMWYYYVMVDMVECPGEYALDSETISSLFLTAEPDAGFDPVNDNELMVDLSWQHDPAWDNYSVYRRLHNEEDFQPVVTGISGNTYTDMVNVELLTGTIAYLAKGQKDDLGVHSNYVFIDLEVPQVELSGPNAFRPASDLASNRTFAPEFNIPVIEYTMEVYDRNGLRVFRSDPADPFPSWDGLLPDGSLAPDGAYLYYVTYTPGVPNMEPGQLRGVVYLVR